MGNLLIAPALIALGLFYNAIKSKKDKRTMFGYGGLSFLYIMVLYITFSRGALYAFGIAGALFGIILLIRDKKAWACWMLVPTILGLGFGLLTQGIFAEISPTSENFAQGIQRSIHQVSLGKIDIREKAEDNGDQSSFSGYIEESTDIRINWTETAIKTWKDSNIWFGVGLGNAGTAMSRYTGGSKREIIQNEYINILTELGFVGVLLLIIAISYMFKVSKRPDFVVIIPIVIAYLITLFFFSGFPNVLHLYLLTPVLYHLGHKRILC
jgi:O-antigen ligase